MVTKLLSAFLQTSGSSFRVHTHTHTRLGKAMRSIFAQGLPAAAFLELDGV